MQRDWSLKPLALQLLKEYRNGKTIDQLVRETGVPTERIEMRLRAATAYLKRLSEREGSGTPLSMRRQTLQH